MPTYTYTANTPGPTDPMNVTQPLILANFKAIPELLTVNHVGFNVDNFGTHNVLALQEQSAPTTTATEIDLFCKITGSPNPAELYIVYPQGAATTTPVLFSVPYAATATGTAHVGYVSFASGIKISYGNFTVSGNTSGITLSVPQYTSNSNLGATSAITVNNLWITDLYIIQNGAQAFNIAKFSSGTTTYNYFAIGI